jgi:hypothetical protein
MLGCKAIYHICNIERSLKSLTNSNLAHERGTHLQYRLNYLCTHIKIVRATLAESPSIEMGQSAGSSCLVNLTQRVQSVLDLPLPPAPTFQASTQRCRQAAVWIDTRCNFRPLQAHCTVLLRGGRRGRGAGVRTWYWNV